MYYKTFIRSATSFKTFSSARKKKVRGMLTLAEAQLMCRYWNSNRSDRQIANGTKMEFEKE